MKLVPVTTKKQAEQAFVQLRKTLIKGAKPFVCDVGWPHGSSRRTVYWRDDHGFWAVPLNHPEDAFDRFWCAYGTQNPKHSKSVSITCEINPPKGERNERCAGAFIRDSAGELYVGHSGKVGGGKKGIGKKTFLDFYRGTLENIQWPDGKSTPLIVIGKVSSPEFLSNLAKFIFVVESFKEKNAAKEDIDEALNHYAETADREGLFEPNNVKESIERIKREISLRRGQPEFRAKLLRAYRNRCAISNCDCTAALEAAHIRPYGGSDTNHVQNGILLRSDLHSLFDLGKIGIDPVSRKVIVATPLMNTVYGKLNGKKVRRPAQSAQLPHEEVLRQHLERWGLK